LYCISRQEGRGSQPFLLIISTTAPHGPSLAEPKYSKEFKIIAAPRNKVQRDLDLLIFDLTVNLDLTVFS